MAKGVQAKWKLLLKMSAACKGGRNVHELFSFPVATQTLTHDCFTQAPSYVVLAALCAKECKLNLKCNCNACGVEL